MFFDRSFLDAIAYSTLIGQPVSPAMLEAAERRRFANPIFVCPPWREVFAQDSERQHDFEFARKDYAANIEA